MRGRRLLTLCVLCGCGTGVSGEPDTRHESPTTPRVIGRLVETREMPAAPPPTSAPAEVPTDPAPTPSEAPRITMVSSAAPTASPTEAPRPTSETSPVAPDDAPDAPAPALSMTTATSVRSGPATDVQRAMAKEIQEQVACLRGRPFLHDVAIEFQSIEDFRAFVQEELKREEKSPRARREQRLLKAVGLIGFDEDLLAMIERATVEQAAAYYDPAKNTFYIVKAMPDLMLRATMAHELQHALQDQHSKALDTYTKGEFETLDAGLAARFVVEGEASLVGNAWTMLTAAGLPMLGDVMPSPCGEGRAGASDRALFWTALREMTVKVAGQTRAEIQNPGIVERLLTQALSPSVAESMRMLDALPNFAYYTMVPPYTFGSFSMYEVLKSDGWKWEGIDRLFERMPATTAEVLHPEVLIAGTRFANPMLWRPADHPFDTKGWRADPRDQVGELGLRIILMNGGARERDAKIAAQGWAGDSVRVWTRRLGDGEFLAYDWNLHASDAAAAKLLQTSLWEAIERRRGELDLLGEVSPLDATSGFLVFAYTGHQNRRRFGRVAWSPSGVVVSEGWLEPPTGVEFLP